MFQTTHSLLLYLFSRSGFCLLGAPIGPKLFSESIVIKRVEKIRCAIDFLHDLRDAQMENTLLCSCLAMPKFNFALRSCPPSLISQATTSFDDLMRDTLSDIAGGSLSNWSWLKAQLPCSFGGLNLRSATLYAPAAYISSLEQSEELRSRILNRFSAPSTHLIPALASAADSPGWISLEDIDVPLCQKSLTNKIDVAQYNTLLSSAPDTRSRALALSSAIPHAGDWLNVIPSSSLGLHL